MSRSILSKFKKIYNRHEEIITLAIIVIWILATIVSSFFLTFKVFQKPLTNEQIANFKEVTYNVYHEGANVLYEADTASDVNLELRDNNIIVRSSNSFYRGFITATPENGTLSFEYNKEIISTVILSIMIGIIAFTLELLFLCGCLCLSDFIKDLNSKLKSNNKRKTN